MVERERHSFKTESFLQGLNYASDGFHAYLRKTKSHTKDRNFREKPLTVKCFCKKVPFYGICSIGSETRV